MESVHLEQVREQEEHERAAVGHRTVHLRGLDHDHLGLLGDDDLLANLDRGGLRVLEVLDELDVLGHVAFSLGELLEDASLELGELDLEAVLLRDQVCLELRQVGALELDGHIEQLVLEAVLGDHEVDERRLGLDLGRVVRVRELRLQVELEVGRVVHLLVAELDNLVAPALDRLAPNDRAEHSVDDQLDVLDHARRATLDARAEDRHDRLLAETHHFEAARLLVLLDPLDALQLRVDHERPARAARDDGAVLRRHRVGR